MGMSHHPQSLPSRRVPLVLDFGVGLGQHCQVLVEFLQEKVEIPPGLWL